jgi:hypothetical protein
MTDFAEDVPHAVARARQLDPGRISLLRESFGADKVIGVDASVQSLNVARRRDPTDQRRALRRLE